MRRALFGVFLFGSIACLAADGSAPQVKPTFGWPSDFHATVAMTIEVKQWNSVEGDSKTRFEASSRWTVEKDGGRLFVRRTVPEGWKRAADFGAMAIAQRVVDYVPTIVVGSNGAFLGIEGLAEGRSQFVEEGGPSLFSGLSKETLMSTALSDGGLKAIVQDFWSALVESWIVWRDELGTGHVFSFESAVPQLGGDNLQFDGRSAETGTEECSRGGIVRSCHVYVVTTSANPAQVKKLVANMMTSGQPAPFRFVSWDQSTETRLVAEADTLLPHLLRIASRSSMTVEAEGERQSLRQELVKEYRFSYDAQP